MVTWEWDHRGAESKRSRGGFQAMKSDSNPLIVLLGKGEQMQ